VGLLRKRLLSAKPKALFGQELDGKHLLSLARAILVTMNKGGVVPSIKSAWEYVVDQVLLIECTHCTALTVPHSRYCTHCNALTVLHSL
jgi:hypothetical protein